MKMNKMPGLDHGGMNTGAMPEAFKFFNEHIKPASNRKSAPNGR